MMWNPIELEYKQGEIRADSIIGNYALDEFKYALNNGQARILEGNRVSFVVSAPADKIVQVYRKMNEQADEIEKRLGTIRNRDISEV